MLMNLVDTTTPDEKLLATASPFEKECHARMVYFVTTYIEAANEDERDTARCKAPLTRKIALNYRMAHLLKKETDGVPVEMKDLQLLRKYKASLTEQQYRTLDAWAIHSPPHL